MKSASWHNGNRIYRTEHRFKKKEYINIKIKIHNLQNQTKAYKTSKHIYNDKKNETKRT